MCVIGYILTTSSLRLVFRLWLTYVNNINRSMHIIYNISSVKRLFYVSGTLSIQCAGRNDSVWHYANTIYVTQPTKKTFPTSTESLFACKMLCINESEFCFAVLFNKYTNTCLWFKESTNMDYHLYVLDSRTELGYIRHCATGK